MDVHEPQIIAQDHGLFRWSRPAAAALIVGGGFLLSRTIVLMAGGALLH
jgi:hypothetical protein